MPAGRHTCAAHAEAWGRDALRVGALRAVAIVPQCLTYCVSSSVISPQNGRCDGRPAARREEA